MKDQSKTYSKDLLCTLADLIDAVVAVYLTTAIQPFVKMHEKFYSGMNKILRAQLDKNHVPTWVTANFITYVRTALVVPTLIFLSMNFMAWPAVIVIAVDFGDFLDGVVARYWVDRNKKRKQEEDEKKKETSRAPSPASDADSFGTSCSVFVDCYDLFRFNFLLIVV
jgi:hypothetical protein